MNALVLLMVLFLGFLLAAVLLFKVILPLAMALALLLAGLALFALYIGSIIWAYEDANARGKPGWAVALLVAFVGWPFCLLAWYVFRPDKKLDRVNAGPTVLPSASVPPPV